MTTTTIAPPAPPRRRPFGPGRVVVLVIGAVLALIGLVSIVAGGLVLRADRHRVGGYLTSEPGRFATDTYAIAAPAVHIHGAGPDYFYQDALIGEVRLQLRPADAADALFVGVGPSDQVAAYLDRVRHDEFTDLELDPFTVDYVRRAGDRPTTAPTAQTFWAASDSGVGPRTLTWTPGEGDWTVVVMNADGSAGVQADISVGGELPVVRIAGITTVVVGILMLLAGLAMAGLAALTRGRRRPMAGSRAG